MSHWFHAWKRNGSDSVITYQGQIVAEIEQAKWYLVQLYEWVSGSPSKRIIVSFDAMAKDGPVDGQGWSFYQSNGEMQAAYEIYAIKRENQRSVTAGNPPPASADLTS